MIKANNDVTKKKISSYQYYYYYYFQIGRNTEIQNKNEQINL